MSNQLETLFLHLFGDGGRGGKTAPLTDAAFRLYLGLIETCHANGHALITWAETRTVHLNKLNIQEETLTPQAITEHLENIADLLLELEESDLLISAFSQETHEQVGFTLPFMDSLLESDTNEN